MLLWQGRKKMRGTMGVAVAMLFAPMCRAEAGEVDQRQVSVDTQAASFLVGGESGQALAQVITPGMSGTLAEVRLPIRCATGLLTLEIRGVAEDLPDARVLASESLTTTRTSADTLYRTVALTARPAVAPGEKIALVLESSGTCEVLAAPAGDVYPDGSGYYRNRTLEPGVWTSLGTRDDLPFETIVERRAEEVVVHVNLDAEEDIDEKDDKDRKGAFVAVRCFVGALGW